MIPANQPDATAEFPRIFRIAVPLAVRIHPLKYREVPLDPTAVRAATLAEEAGLTIPVGEFDLTTTDAAVIAFNPATGEGRRFRIATATRGSLEGRRVVEVREGHDWIGFGFADGFGVKVWGRLHSAAEPTAYDRYAGFLGDLRKYQAKGYRIMVARIGADL